MADIFIGDHLLTKTHTSDEALEGNRFVKLVTATGIQPHIVYADAGEAACGVVREKIATAKLANVVQVGTAYVMTAENIAAGQAVAAANDGKAAVAASTNQILGQAMTDANSGEMVLVLLSLGGIY